MNNLIDETGNRYGFLTVLSKTKDKNGRTAWLCQCDCGNLKVVRGPDLRKNRITSCAKNCLCKGKDETGKTYGYLKVIERDLTPASSFPDHSIHWICKCLICGNITSISGKNLRNENTKSCGCLNSFGEKAICEILVKNNIKFKKEFTIDELSQKENKKYRFDFAILNGNNEILFLIEFQGPQHFNDSHFFHSSLKERNESDEIKYNFITDKGYSIIYFNNVCGNFKDKYKIEMEREILNFYNRKVHTKESIQIDYYFS